jgi:hypothetical protein
MEDLSGMPAA